MSSSRPVSWSTPHGPATSVVARGGPGHAWVWAEGLHPRSSADTGGDVQRVLGKLEARGLDELIVRLVANSPNVFRPFVLLADALLTKATLPATDREVLILHLARKLGNDYEWSSHEPLAEKVGVGDAQRAALRRGDAGSDPELFSPSQRLAVRLSDELLETKRWSEASWRAAVDTWGQEGALDLVFSIAWWGAFVPSVIGALALRSATGQ